MFMVGFLKEFCLKCVKEYKRKIIKIGFAYLATFFVSFAIFTKVYGQDVKGNFSFWRATAAANSGKKAVNFRLPDFSLFSLFRFGGVESFIEMALEFEPGTEFLWRTVS